MKEKQIIDLRKIDFAQIYLEITNKCNLECEYCFNSSGLQGDEYLSLEEIKSFIGMINYETEKPVVYISGGEPLTHPDIKNILQTLVQEMGVNVTLLSNGKLASNSELKNMDLAFNWQIGSAQLATVELFRNNWESYKHNIQELLDRYSKSTVTVAYTVTAKNYMNLGTFLSEFADHKNVNILVSFVQKRGRGIGSWDDIVLPSSKKIELIMKYSGSSNNMKFCGVSLDKDISRILYGDVQEQNYAVKEFYVDYNKNIHFCTKLDNYLKEQSLELQVDDDGRVYYEEDSVRSMCTCKKCNDCGIECLLKE